jgi:hypothetical protein
MAKRPGSGKSRIGDHRHEQLRGHVGGERNAELGDDLEHHLSTRRREPSTTAPRRSRVARMMVDIDDRQRADPREPWSAPDPALEDHDGVGADRDRVADVDVRDAGKVGELVRGASRCTTRASVPTP